VLYVFWFINLISYFTPSYRRPFHFGVSGCTFIWIAAVCTWVLIILCEYWLILVCPLMYASLNKLTDSFAVIPIHIDFIIPTVVLAACIVSRHCFTYVALQLPLLTSIQSKCALAPLQRCLRYPYRLLPAKLIHVTL